MKVIDFCLQVCSGGTPLRSENRYWENGTIPWLKTGEIKKQYIYGTEEFITPVGLAESSAKLIPANSVTIAMYGDGDTAGHAALTKIPLSTNQACCNLVLDRSKANPNFIYFLFKANYTNLINLKLGGSQQNLNSTTIKNLEFNLPPLPIQRKIAAVLSAYDDLIENNNRRIALLEKMGEELYREWFVRLRFPGHESTKIVKGVPEGWEVKPAGCLLEVIKGRSYSTEEIADFRVTENHNMLATLKNFNRGGGFRSNAEKYYLGKYTPDQLVSSGSIIMAVTDMTQERAVVARSARIPKGYIADGEKCIISCDVVKIAPKIKYHSFLYALLRYSSFPDSLKQWANGANVLHLRPDLISKQLAVIPDDDSMKAFDDLLGPILNASDQLWIANRNLSTSRDRLLTRLMSGKIDLESLDIAFPPSMQEAA